MKHVSKITHIPPSKDLQDWLFEMQQYNIQLADTYPHIMGMQVTLDMEREAFQLHKSIPLIIAEMSDMQAISVTCC